MVGYNATLQFQGCKPIPIREISFGKLTSPPRTAINDLGSMLAAKLLLMDTSKRIIIPSAEEWIGINCLERDDDLPNRRKDA